MTALEERKLQLVRASVEDKPIFRNLMQFYKYDTSDFTLEDPNAFGQFDYNYLDHYWTEHGRIQEGRIAYLVKVDGVPAGFALVNQFNLSHQPRDNTRNIAEFFIMRKWRRKGVGRWAAMRIFDTFKGTWEVKQEKENRGAQLFWERVVQEYTQGQYSRVDTHEPEWAGPVIRFQTD